MPTLSEVNTPPASGLLHIDALLDNGPGWNWLTPARTTLYYTFSLAAANPDAATAISGGATAFSPAQQAATVTALALLAQITGIHFALTGDASQADLHFSAADISDAHSIGLCSWSTGFSTVGNNVVSYRADAWIYLDNANHAAQTANPSAGSEGFEVLLHELGHAMGLKHPFAGTVLLPPAQDHTANTLMSYTELGGPYSQFRPYDIAALRFLYGNDGLGGALGQGSAGQFLTGSDAADTLVGGAGNDQLEGAGGDDRLIGGLGLDTARYPGQRSDYRVTSAGQSVQALSGAAGHDTLEAVERLLFADAALAFDLDGHAGTVARILGAVFGRAAVAHRQYAGIGLQLLDGGMKLPELLALALDARLGPGYSQRAEVELLFGNLVGRAPDAQELAYWVGTLERGEYSAIGLAQLAVELELNALNIDLVGLIQQGLPYQPGG